MELGGAVLDFNDPLTLALLGGAGVLLLIVLLLIMAVRAAGASARVAAPLAQQMRILGGHVQQLGQGQEQLRGGLQMVSETQSNTQAQMMQSMEARLAHVQQQMQDRLAENAARSARALAEMQQRMTETLHGSSKRTTTSHTQLQEHCHIYTSPSPRD